MTTRFRPHPESSVVDMPAMTSSPDSCLTCGAAVVGKFCSECGTPRASGRCARCDAALAAGARFCGECGAPTDSRMGSAVAGSVARRSRPVPRAAAGVVAVTLVAVVVFVAVRLGSRPAPSGTLPLAPTPQGTVVAGPDISNMSPRERASRLYDRVMRLHEERKPDSIAFFAPMALNSYAAIPDIDLDGRYDMARVAMIAGALPVARAQSDTILRRDATHLLGLMLAADLARSTNNEAAAARAERAFVAAAPRERQRNLPEYNAHAAEIDAVLRRLTGTKR